MLNTNNSKGPLPVGLQRASSTQGMDYVRPPAPANTPTPDTPPVVSGGRWNRAGKSSWKPGPFTLVESAKAHIKIDLTSDTELGDMSESPARLSPVASVRSVGVSFAGSYTDSAADAAPAASSSGDGAVAIRNKNSVDCNTCFAVGHWRTMRMVRVVDHWQETKMDAEDTYVRVQTCMECVAVEMGCSVEEAYKVVMAGPIAHKKKRYDQLMYAKANVRTQIESLSGVTRKERRTMTMCEVFECFAPLGKHIMRKRAAKERLGVDVKRHAELVLLLDNCTSFAEECPIIKEMESLEVDDGYLAFADQPDQHDFIMASSYSDQWSELVDASGKCTGSVNSWYICKSGKGPWCYETNKVTPCYRITPSKEWGRKHEDPLATKQSWYCSCWSKYNATWGQIVEISRYSFRTKQMEKIYLRSDLPPWDEEDVRAMHLEETLKPKSSRELYEKVKALRPVANAIIEERDGHMRIIDSAAYNSLTEFKWVEINNMVL
jgi:hypothetical protein